MVISSESKGRIWVEIEVWESRRRLRKVRAVGPTLLCEAGDEIMC